MWTLVSAQSYFLFKPNIRVTEQALQRDVLDALLFTSRIGRDVVRKNAAPKTAKLVGSQRADAARTNHASRAAEQVESHQAVEREVAFTHARVGAVDMTIRRQHHKHADA